MAINKIMQNGNTLMDLTGDTATAADVTSGVTFHLANGQQATGSRAAVTPQTASFYATTSGYTATFSVTHEPSYWVCALRGTMSYSNNGVVFLASYTYDTYTDTTRVMDMYKSAASSAELTVGSDVTTSYQSGVFSITLNRTGGNFKSGSTYMLVYI